MLWQKSHILFLIQKELQIIVHFNSNYILVIVSIIIIIIVKNRTYTVYKHIYKTHFSFLKKKLEKCHG